MAGPRPPSAASAAAARFPSRASANTRSTGRRSPRPAPANCQSLARMMASAMTDMISRMMTTGPPASIISAALWSMSGAEVTGWVTSPVMASPSADPESAAPGPPGTASAGDVSAGNASAWGTSPAESPADPLSGAGVPLSRGVCSPPSCPSAAGADAAPVSVPPLSTSVAVSGSAFASDEGSRFSSMLASPLFDEGHVCARGRPDHAETVGLLTLARLARDDGVQKHASDRIAVHPAKREGAHRGLAAWQGRKLHRHASGDDAVVVEDHEVEGEALEAGLRLIADDERDLAGVLVRIEPVQLHHQKIGRAHV